MHLDVFCQFRMDVHVPDPPSHDAGKQVCPPYHRVLRPDGTAHLPVDHGLAQPPLGGIVCRRNARIEHVQEQVRFRIAQLDSQELLELRDLSVCVNESSDAPAQHVAHAVPILKASARLEPDPVYLPELVYYGLRLGAFRISFLDVLDLVEDVRPAPRFSCKLG